MAAKKAAKKSSAKKTSAKKKVVKVVKKALKAAVKKVVKKAIIKRSAPKPKVAETPVSRKFPATIEQYHERMRYWRQMTSQAREFIREQYKLIREGRFSEAKFSAAVKAMSKRWVGPKVPVKNPQRPHRNSF